MRSHQSYQTFCVEQCASTERKNLCLVLMTLCSECLRIADQSQTPDPGSENVSRSLHIFHQSQELGLESAFVTNK